jgi:4-hydroxy-3-methylbut-2-en-1-yl diphosphate synthase IspG/GcpE
MNTGLSLIPTEAGVVGMGLIGGMVGMAASLLAGGIGPAVRLGRRMRIVESN